MLFLQSTGAAAEDSAAEVQKEVSAISSWAESFSGMPIDKIIEKLTTEAVDFVLKLLVAAIVFYVGKLIINRIHKSIKNLMIRRQVDRSLSIFILSALKVTLLFILIIIVISILGIETSSFIALFASAGVAIGMALSGTLQNFAGGVLILLLKPYKVGDFIEVQGFTGTVKEIQIFNTILNTVDNKSIFIPNGGLSTGSIKNYSKEDYRRVDWTVNIAYGNDYDVAKNAIAAILSSDNRIVKQYIEDDREERKNAKQTETGTADVPNEEEPEKKGLGRLFHHKKKLSAHLQALSKEEATTILPAAKADRSPFIALGALSSSSVDIIVRAWVPASEYWNVLYDINERIYKELPKAGIDFPFPQLDVHLSK